MNAEDKADFNTPMLTTREQLTAMQQITGNGGMAIKGGQGANFEGNITQTSGNYTTDGDIQSGDISLRRHKHPNGHNGADTGSSKA